MNRPVLPFFAIILVCIALPAQVRAETGREIIEASGVHGGLVVHVQCGDGRLTADLAAGPSYLVQGLSADAGAVDEARRHIRSRGLYGRVSVDTFDSRRLPYVDNLVNLVVVDELRDVSMDEVMRILAPLGVAYINGKKTVKPWPEEIDEWTHYLHGPYFSLLLNWHMVLRKRRSHQIIRRSGSGPCPARSPKCKPLTGGKSSGKSRRCFVAGVSLLGREKGFRLLSSHWSILVFPFRGLREQVGV